MATAKKKKATQLTNEVQLVKIAFPKKKTVIDVTDLGMEEEYKGIKFVMWADPSIAVIQSVLYAQTGDEKELTDEDADQYFDALTELLIDSNIEGISFATSKDVQDSFDAMGVPWGFVSMVCALYCVKVIDESEALKKMYGLLEEAETSGENSNQTEQKSIQD